MLTYSRASIEAHIDYCASKGKPLSSPLTGEEMAPGLMANVLVRRLVCVCAEQKRQQWAEWQAGNG